MRSREKSNRSQPCRPRRALSKTKRIPPVFIFSVSSRLPRRSKKNRFGEPSNLLQAAFLPQTEIRRAITSRIRNGPELPEYRLYIPARTIILRDCGPRIFPQVRRALTVEGHPSTRLVEAFGLHSPRLRKPQLFLYCARSQGLQPLFVWRRETPGRSSDLRASIRTFPLYNPRHMSADAPPHSGIWLITCFLCPTAPLPWPREKSISCHPFFQCHYHLFPIPPSGSRSHILPPAGFFFLWVGPFPGLARPQTKFSVFYFIGSFPTKCLTIKTMSQAGHSPAKCPTPCCAP